MTALKIRQCRGSAGTGKDYHFVVGGWPRVPVHGTTVHAVVLCRESRVGWVSSHKPNFKLRSVTTSHSEAAERKQLPGQPLRRDNLCACAGTATALSNL
jgi:hypothetical protein